MKHTQIVLEKPVKEYPGDYSVPFTCPGCGKEVELQFYLLEEGNFVVAYDLEDPCTCSFEIYTDPDGKVIDIYAEQQEVNA